MSPSSAGLLISALVLSVAFMSLVVAPLVRPGGAQAGAGRLFAAARSCRRSPARSRRTLAHLVVAMRFLQGALIPGVLAVSVAYLTRRVRAAASARVGRRLHLGDRRRRHDEPTPERRGERTF